ncbi:MAG: hypothetical protein WD802_11365 [Gemmatimonadaceae bacterium]
MVRVPADKAAAGFSPLVVMTHGYGEYEGYEMHEEFIRHTVRKDNVVIYPRWQAGPFTPCAAGRQIEAV